MIFLAVETSSVACSVALSIEREVTERHVEKAREHTKLVIPMIEELLSEAGLAVDDLNALVLGNGPGSFIGLRIAASVVQGIAFAAKLKVVPVSSMLGVATEALADTEFSEAVVTADAHMQEVYLGQFAHDAERGVVASGVERLHPIAEIEYLTEQGSASRVAAGEGWLRYPGLYDLNRSKFSTRSTVVYPRARFLLPEAERLYLNGRAISAEQIAPTYLRKQVATPKAGP